MFLAVNHAIKVEKMTKSMTIEMFYSTYFIIPGNILKFNYKQTIQWIIIILMPIKPEILQVFSSYITNAQCVHID